MHTPHPSHPCNHMPCPSVMPCHSHALAIWTGLILQSHTSCGWHHRGGRLHPYLPCYLHTPPLRPAHELAERRKLAAKTVLKPGYQDPVAFSASLVNMVAFCASLAAFFCWRAQLPRLLLLRGLPSETLQILALLRLRCDARTLREGVRVRCARVFCAACACCRKKAQQHRPWLVKRVNARPRPTAPRGVSV